ncbi:MAG TPA: SDR family NAD(P)-dependent oxidoreductase [Dongiaceae bacterium]|nr:SDR family NAD(P)-dependent oxidoreductase [Dongiaceae bacterium]
MAMSIRPFAIVTGASTGIGYELARCCAMDGYDLLIVADEPNIHYAADELAAYGTHIYPLVADLSGEEGVDILWRARRNIDRRLDALLANAGRGLGGAFLDQDFADIRHVIETNVTGTLDLLHRAAGEMRRHREGRILITGSIAGFIPGSYQAAYNGSKAFIDSFSYALREELKDTGVTVTCLMPGATETEFFRRANMLDTNLGTAEKDDPAEVARLGYEALKAGKADVVTGFKNKLQVAVAAVTPAPILAGLESRRAAPGTAKK